MSARSGIMMGRAIAMVTSLTKVACYSGCDSGCDL